jgi:hypothetical protein
MTVQAYLDNIYAKTGKTPEDFKKLAEGKTFAKHSDLVAWLKTDFGLGHGHANLIAHLIRQAEEPPASRDDKIEQHFSGAKSAWRDAFETLLQHVKTFGPDVDVAPTNSYISLVRDNRKFAIVQPTAKRLDIGIKRADAPAEGRFEPSGNWNAMVTHRVRIEDAAQIDDEVYSWLRDAYDRA